MGHSIAKITLSDAYKRNVDYTIIYATKLLRYLDSISQVYTAGVAPVAYWQFSYDLATSSIYPLMTATSRLQSNSTPGTSSGFISYNSDGTVYQTTDANGNTESYVYQADVGKTIVTSCDAQKKVLDQWTAAYDTNQANRSTAILDANANSTSVEYKSPIISFAPSQKTNANGQKINNSYDAFGHLTDSIYPNGNGTGNLRTHYEYEYDNSTNSLYPNGRIKYIAKVPDGTDPSTAKRKIAYSYNASGLTGHNKNTCA